MEVEIEDLHLQIDDIAKAKTAVRHLLCRAGLRENTAVTVAAFTPNRGPFPARALHTRVFCRESRPPSSVPPTHGRGRGRGEVEEGASKGPSPCLTTCLWELGRRPQHHK